MGGTISDATHAAIIGGVISGAVVLLGILLAEWLRRAQDRHTELRNATRVISLRSPVALSNLLPDASDPRRLQQGSPGWEVFQEVLTAALAADVASRPRITRRRATIRRSLDELTVRMGAAHVRWLATRQLITHEQMLSVGVQVGALNRAVFGKRSLVDDLWDRYVSEGLPVEGD